MQVSELLGQRQRAGSNRSWTVNRSAIRQWLTAFPTQACKPRCRSYSAVYPVFPIPRRLYFGKRGLSVLEVREERTGQKETGLKATELSDRLPHRLLREVSLRMKKKFNFLEDMTRIAIMTKHFSFVLPFRSCLS